MGIKGISLSEVKDFVSQYDKEEPKTIWKLGVLDSDVFDLIGGRTDNQLSTMTDVVRFGLKGFENFKDAQGNEIKFSTTTRVLGITNYKVVSDSLIKIIPPEVKYELANEIISSSRLNEEEIKN